MNELVYLKNDEAVCSSLLVAEKFEKRHADVMRAIDNLVENDSTQNCVQCFKRGTYKDSTGKSNKMYVMNRDGFTFLVMGFTGKKCIFAFPHTVARKKYVQLQSHLLENGEYVIKNTVLRCDSGSQEGTELPEKEWKQLKPFKELAKEVRTGSSEAQFVIDRLNITNNADENNPMGVAIFANAIDTLKKLDIEYDSYCNEFELGRKRIFVRPEIPIQESNEIIQGVIAQSAVLSRGRKLANMTSKQYKMPVLDMLPIAYFVNGDSGQKKTTKQAWDKKFIIAEEIAVIVPIPEAVLDDSQYDIWGEVKPRVTEAFGNKIDGAVLFGTDKPSTWRDDVVATATKVGSVVTLGSADPLYDKIMEEDGVIAKVENCGYMVNGHMADISMRAKLRGLKNANGDPLFKTDMQGSTQYALDGSPMNFPNNGSFDKTKALMISGDFSQLVYSIRQDITFKLFTEGVVQNTDGSIAYNLMQNDMVALRAVMRLGWEIPNPINALVKDKTKRCPFSILKAGE